MMRRAKDRLNGLSVVIATLGCATVMMACKHEINVQENLPADSVAAVFDPSHRVVPTPTDLAVNPTSGVLAVPVADSEARPAQAAFDTFLNTLNGYPETASAAACFSGDVDLDSFAGNVAVLNITDAMNPVAVTDVSPGRPVKTISCPVFTGVLCNPVSPECADEEICVPQASATAGECAKLGYQVSFSKATPWARGSRYAFMLFDGLKDSKGRNLIRSALFDIAAATTPLCEVDQSTGKCTFNYNGLLETQVDKAVRAANPNTPESELAAMVHEAILASATNLEPVRKAISSTLPLAAAANKTADDVILAWTFGTVSQVEAAFNPAAADIPGPGNDLIFNATDNHVQIPPPARCAADADCAASGTCDSTTGECSTFHPTEGLPAKQLRFGLNTLDGFSSTATYYARFSGDLDPASLTKDGAVLLIQFDLADVRTIETDVAWAPEAKLLTLTPKSPLKENTRHIVVLQSDIKRDANGNVEQAAAGGLTDTQGRRVIPSSAFALARIPTPLVANGESNISVVDDATAAALEPLRASYNTVLSVIEGRDDVSREDIVQMWTFKTQSYTTTATSLRALPYSALAPADSNMPMFSGTLKAGNVTPWSANPIPTISGYSDDGTFVSVNLLDPATGAFHPDPSNATPAQVPFLLMVPDAAVCCGGQTPANGWPVIVFNHGITRQKEDAVAIGATAASAGYATIAFDIPFHGARSVCSSAADCSLKACATASDCDAGDTCTNSICDATRGTCTNGVCSTSLKDDDMNNVPDASGGGAFLNTANPFAIRDNIRQHLIDSSAILRGLKLNAEAGLTGGSAALLDQDKVYVMGQSLGAMLSTVVLATDDLPKRGALNVGGAPIVRIFEDTNSAGFRALIDAALVAQGIVDGEGKADRTSVAAFQLFHTFQWILDPADPANYAPFAAAGGLTDQVLSAQAGQTVKVPAKELIAQIAGDDNTIPTARQAALADWLGLSDVSLTTFADKDHGMLFEGNGTTNNTGLALQTQILTFFTSGMVCTADLAAGTCTVQ